MNKKEMRGAKKGENRFKRAQDESVNHKIELIDNCLQVLRKSKVSFNHTTALAKHVANIINEEGSLKRPLSYVTLLRNNVYRVKLESYQLSTHKESSKIKVNNLTYELEIKELKREIAILRKYAENYNIRIENKAHISQPQKPCYKEQQDISKLCKLINEIIASTDGSIEPDTNNKVFIKPWLKSSNRTVGTKSMATPYFKWLVMRDSINKY